MESRGKNGMVLLAGNSHPDLTEKIARHLGISVGACLVTHNSNRETVVDIQESVRGKDVYILQTASTNVNDIIMELLVIGYACKTSNCKNIIGVLPCMPYSQQTKMRRRGNISLKLFADMCVSSGFTHIITIDLHSKESQGFFRCRMDNLRASPFFLQYVVENIPDHADCVIVARTPMLARRASSIADRLRVSIAVLHGEWRDDERDDDDGRASPPPAPHQESGENENKSDDVEQLTTDMDRSRIYTIGSTLPSLIAKERPPLYVVGDVSNKVAIMVDDIIDDVKNTCNAARVLKESGARKVYVMATHGILSNEAPRLLEESDVDEIVVSNTVPLERANLQTNKIRSVDISILLAEAIRRIHNKESMSHLFRNVTTED